MLLDDLVNAIKDLFFSLMYLIFSGVCSLIDFIKDVFYKLCGIETVVIGGEDSDVLTTLIRSNSINKVFLSVFLIGVLLLATFTVVAVIKTNYQEKRDWKHVYIKAGQSFLVMLIIPFIIFAGIMLTNTVMSSINLAMQDTLNAGNSLIGGQFLITIGSNSYIGSDSKMTIENMFASGVLDYRNIDVVKQYYNISSLNYIIGILGSIFMLVMFVLSSITFIQRIFDVIMLYIIAPISASTIPLDDGAKFKVWKELFISKLLSAYGVILVMNLFFLIIPQIYNIRFFEDNFQNGLMHLLFLVGGSYSVSKASRVVTQLCGGQPNNSEFLELISAIHTGGHLAKSSFALASSMGVSLIAGKDYKVSRSKGKGIKESFKTSFTSSNAQALKNADINKKKKYGAMPLRIASMPAGMLNDFYKGGLVRVGRNFIPRCRNAFKGETFFNHPQAKKASATSSNTESNINLDEVNATNTHEENTNTQGEMKNETNTKDNQN